MWWGWLVGFEYWESQISRIRRWPQIVFGEVGGYLQANCPEVMSVTAICEIEFICDICDSDVLRGKENHD
jgi:hypothetical protein